MRRLVAVPLVAALVPLGAVVATVPARAAAASTPGGYVAVAPKRVADTRVGLNVPRARVAAGHTITAAILGHGGLPGSGVSAVQVTITVLSPTASGGITAFGAGSAPGTTNLQFSVGQAVSDEAIVPVSGSGIQLKDTQSSGTADVVVDLQGYYRSGTPSQTGAYHPLASAVRAVDTRTGTGLARRAPLGARAAVVATPRGLPSTGVGAVAITVTAVGPARAGSIVAWPTGSARPLPASLYFAAAKGGSAFAVVPLAGGHLDLYNSSSAAVDVVVDVVGYYAAGVPLAAGTFGSLAPNRVYAAGIAAGQIRPVRVTGGGVPRPAGTVALVSITVVGPTRGGGITAWQSAVARPATTSMQFGAGQEIIRTAAVPISASGYINLYNASSGSATVVLDVHGYVAPTTIQPAAPSRARYANDLVRVVDKATLDQDVALMDGHGCADAQAGARVVLLDLGVQSKTPDLVSHPYELGPTHPGVTLALAVSDGDSIRIRYDLLRYVLRGYLDGYTRCRVGTTTVTVAIGTNNGGVYSGANSYPATTRGTDWADQLIDPLASYAAANSVPATVVGADDIEAEFDPSHSVTNVSAWESAYFAATTARLVYNGDANSCPATFGVTHATCAYGWTQAQYYALAHNGSRTLVLPQTYFLAEAVKWANIDATGGGGLLFIGALTEHARVSSELTPDQGRAALYRAVSSVAGAPSVPYGIDLAADGN